MMNELEELLKQRREITERIRQLKEQAVICGRAKLDIERFPTSRPDEWYVAIKQLQFSGREVWRSVIRNTDKQAVIDQIDDIINDLQALKQKVGKL